MPSRHDMMEHISEAQHGGQTTINILKLKIDLPDEPPDRA
jgi:hypothetical protein